ncbi:MAG: hypothetical protein R3D00_20630 [Bacteroidia bacterium]
MKNFLALPILFILVSGFTLNPAPAHEELPIGTYGVGVCDGIAVENIQVQLTLNEDFTFHYINNSNPSKRINVSGTWTLKGKTIRLKDYSSATAIPAEWMIAANYPCLKSRKGMEFTRLCQVN